MNSQFPNNTNIKEQFDYDQMFSSWCSNPGKAYQLFQNNQILETPSSTPISNFNDTQAKLSTRNNTPINPLKRARTTQDFDERTNISSTYSGEEELEPITPAEVNFQQLPMNIHLNKRQSKLLRKSSQQRSQTLNPMTSPMKQKNRLDGNKKLIYLSKQVLKIIKEEKTTSGTQIANKLISQYKSKNQGVEFKNIQRRVYDALNVLAALDYITKHRQGVIKFKGTGTLNNYSISKLKQDIEKRQQINLQKKKKLLELVTQEMSIRKLITRNLFIKDSIKEDEKLYLPIVLLKADDNSQMLIQLNENKTEAKISMDNAYQLYDDNIILKKLQFHKTNLEELNASLSPQLVQLLAKDRFLESQPNIIENSQLSGRIDGASTGPTNSSPVLSPSQPVDLANSALIEQYQRIFSRISFLTKYQQSPISQSIYTNQGSAFSPNPNTLQKYRENIKKSLSPSLEKEIIPPLTQSAFTPKIHSKIEDNKGPLPGMSLYSNTHTLSLENPFKLNEESSPN